MAEKLTEKSESSVHKRHVQTSVGESESSIADGSIDRNKPDRPIHVSTPSLFSVTSGFNDYRGFLNLCVVLLVLSNFRVALENVIKYGILIDPYFWIDIFSESRSPNTILVLSSNFFVLFALWIEKRLASGVLSESWGHSLHVVSLAVVLVLPAVVVLALHPFPMFSMFTMGLYSVIFLKLISYHAVNRWCRIWRSRHPEGPALKPGEVAYPQNLTIKNIYYFFAAPTLCYEINFPRTEKIRIRFLLKRIAEVIILSAVMLALIQQWMLPTVRNALQPFQRMDISRVVERICRLAIPNHIIWLIAFYWLFHSFLNLTAELLRFGDREFYRDWWNSESVESFWQNWNICVHRWCVRHLYKPLLYRNYTKFQASCAVFIVSAFFHEYMVSVPLCMFRLWAFFAMVLQLPLAFLVKKYMNGVAANVAVWLSLIVGQPIAIMMYFHDYYVLHMTSVNFPTNSTIGL